MDLDKVASRRADRPGEFSPDSANRLERKVTQDIESAVQITVSDMEKILHTKGLIIIRVVGKSGAGKTVYANSLMKQLKRMGRVCQLISVDDYVEEMPAVESPKHNLAKLVADIEQAQREGKIVIIEGILPESSKGMKIESDYKVFFDASFDRRVAMKILRQSLTIGRNPEETMTGMTIEAGKDANFFAEDLRPEEDTNLLVNNEYEMPGNPQLYIRDNKFTFEAEGTSRVEIGLTEAQLHGLQQLGVRLRK